MAVNNTSLVCCWDQSGRWQQRVVGWPEGVCRDGVPLQREAVGELIADLIFDCDCPGAELVLCLLLEAASWCVVDGYGADGSPGLLPQVLQSVDLPIDLAESYVTSSPVQEALAVMGVPRSLIQSWSEVAEDWRSVGRREPDQHLPEGSPGNFIAVAIRIDRLPVRPMAS